LSTIKSSDKKIFMLLKLIEKSSVWIISILLLTELSVFTFGLLAIEIKYYQWIPEGLNIVIGSILFGGIGGCTYCLRGVYLNVCVYKQWTLTWVPWYFIRPIVSLTLGGVSYLFVKSGLLLFGATQEQNASQLGIWAVAFLAGLNVDKFLAKIESIGQTVWGLEPSRQSKPQNNQESDK